MNKFFCITVFFLLLSPLCWAGGNKDTGTQSQQQTQQPQVQPQAAPQPTQPQAPASPFFTGNGGRGSSLAILAPKSTGLAANQSYLPLLVQGEFVSNFSGYSAISVMDRENMEKVYAELLSGYYSDNDAAGLDLGHLTATDYLMTGNITRTATGYALQIQIAKTADKITAASYSGTCTFAELDNLIGIRRASLDLLQKMGVTPTERTRTELAGAAAANHVNAQTALAQGISAQQSGTVVEALSRYIQANNYDAGLAEAASRMNILSANISSGNIGADTRNDIAWRRQWTERLQEAETFFANYVKDMPYYLIYDSDIRQGTINYQNETVGLSFGMSLLPEAQWVTTINEVIATMRNGLWATGRRSAWGLEWPNKSIGTTSPFTNRTNNYTVIAEIINDQGRSIGRQTVTVPYGYAIMQGSLDPRQWGGSVSFPAVDANLITDRLTIRITSIDGIPAENAARQKRISIMPLEEFYRITRTNLDPSWEVDYSGTLTRYTGKLTYLEIPSTVRGILVTHIGRRVFIGRGLTSVTIPNSVISIGEGAFHAGEHGTERKDENNIRSVTIPDSVRTIGEGAFYSVPLTSITIGSDVNWRASDNNQNYWTSLPTAFSALYNQNGKKAGTYTRNGGWTYSPR